MARNRPGSSWQCAEDMSFYPAEDNMYWTGEQVYPTHGGMHSPSSSIYVNTGSSLSGEPAPITQEDLAQLHTGFCFAGAGLMTHQLCHNPQIWELAQQAARDECKRKHQRYMRQNRKAWDYAQKVAREVNDEIAGQAAYLSVARSPEEALEKYRAHKEEERKQYERNQEHIRRLAEVGSPIPPQLRGRRTLHSPAAPITESEHLPPFNVSPSYVEEYSDDGAAQRLHALNITSPARTKRVGQLPPSLYSVNNYSSSKTGHTVASRNYQPPNIMEYPIPGGAGRDLPASNNVPEVHNFYHHQGAPAYMTNKPETWIQDNPAQYLQPLLFAREREHLRMSRDAHDRRSELLGERVSRLEVGAQLSTAATMRSEAAVLVPVQHQSLQSQTFVPPVGSHMALAGLDPHTDHPFNMATAPDRPLHQGHPTGIMPDPDNYKQRGDQSLTHYAIPHQPSMHDDVFNAIPNALDEFAQHSLPDLLSYVFDTIEGMVRYYTLETDMDIFNYKSGNIQYLFRIGSDHIDSKNMAKTMFQDKELRLPLVIGIVNRCLSSSIFDIALLSEIYKNYDTDYHRIWNEEVRSKNVFELANNYGRRDFINHERARCARNMVAFPDFWRVAQSYAWRLTMDIVGYIIPVVSPHAVNEFQSYLFQPIFNAVKIGVRMRMEPKVYENTFHRYGERWDHTMMAQRNRELAGQICDQQPPIWVVRSTISPMLMEKDFAGGRILMTTLHKAEVMLCDRKTHLRGK